jgi:hypothetical protein
MVRERRGGKEVGRGREEREQGFVRESRWWQRAREKGMEGER